MNTNSSKRNKDSKSSEKDIQDASTGSVTNVGDTSRDITDTADVARASIAKGRVGGDQVSKTVSTTTAADMARGQIEGNQSIIQGATTATATPNTATEDDDNNISRDKVVSSVLHLMKIKVLTKQTSIPQKRMVQDTLKELKKNQ